MVNIEWNINYICNACSKSHDGKDLYCHSNCLIFVQAVILLSFVFLAQWTTIVISMKKACKLVLRSIGQPVWLFMFKMLFTIIYNKCYKFDSITLNPLTSGAFHIHFLHFLLAHYISAFKPVKDKMWHQSARFEICWTPFCQIWIIFTHLKLWIASARHNFKCV